MLGILGWIQIFMRKNTKRPEAIHTWLLMLKASQSIDHYLLPPVIKAGLGGSDVRVLDVLLHKGPMPVNAIGPKVNLNPGSVRVAVDRLYKQGFVSRVESEDDRSVRIVSLTEKGREMFVPLFRQQTALVQQAFQDVSPKEQKQVEDVLKRIGKRADRLASEKNT